MKKTIPGPLWIAIVSLALMVIGKVGFAFKLGPLILVDAALSGLLLFGIILGHRWAYFLAIVFTALGTIKGLSKGIAPGMMIFLVDSLVLVPVLLCRNYFFSSKSPPLTKDT
jgi:hypothetical protein